MAVKVEIICIGNELLIGKTLNTNSQWLAKRVTSLGAVVNRITVVGDDVDEIGKVFREALGRKPRFVVATGGLGPTFDDKTLEGIARGLRRKLEINDKALEMVRGKYDALLIEGRIEKVEMTPARMKMATLPEDSEPLRNPVGTAPGVLTKIDDAFVVALPGVPPEMEVIFDESVVPLLKKEAGESAFFEASLFVEDIMESSLAPLIDRVMQDNPMVYIKSHVYVKSRVQVEGKKSHIELHFSTTGEDLKTSKNHLNDAVAQLSELVERNGGRISRTEIG